MESSSAFIKHSLCSAQPLTDGRRERLPFVLVGNRLARGSIGDTDTFAPAGMIARRRLGRRRDPTDQQDYTAMQNSAERAATQIWSRMSPETSENLKAVTARKTANRLTSWSV
jgi:hypothetical protein